MLRFLFCGPRGVLGLDFVIGNIYLIYSENCLVLSLVGETKLFLLRKFCLQLAKVQRQICGCSCPIYLWTAFFVKGLIVEMWLRSWIQKLCYTCWIITFQESIILWLRICVPWKLCKLWRVFLICPCRFLQLAAAVIYFNINLITFRSGHTVIPRLTKIIRSGITFVSRNVISRRF